MTTSQAEVDIRFGGIQRLYGLKSFELLKNSHVCVVGLGGVGSWTVEALVRSGVGHLTLVDFDDICISNTNRQIHADQEHIGVMKTEALKKRAMSINPDIRVDSIDEAYSPDLDDRLFVHGFDGVVDAIDDLRNKFNLVLACQKRNIPMVIAGAAGGRKEARLIAMGDLSTTREDPMLSSLRKKLRQKANFPRKGSFQLPCVYSTEKPQFFDGQGCMTDERPEQFNRPLDCATGFGTATHITGVFGFMLSQLIIDRLIQIKKND